MKKMYKSKVVVEIWTDEPIEQTSLEEVAYEILEGDWYGETNWEFNQEVDAEDNVQASEFLFE